MRRLPPHLAAAGYSPARYVPLSPAPVSDQGQRLTDIQSIQRLFANGENGGYWPADPAYLYEDSAGTIPASRDGVCGLRMDTSQGSVAQARRNLLTYTEDFSNEFWGDGGVVTKTLVSIDSPSVTQNVYEVTRLYTISTEAMIRISTTQSNATAYSFSIYAKDAGTGGRLYLRNLSVEVIFPQDVVVFDLSTGSISRQGLAVSGVISAVGGGWYRCTVVGTTINPIAHNLIDIGVTNAALNLIGGDAGNSVYISGAQLELGASATPYQKIITGTADLLPGNPAIQATTANKPYLRRTPVSNKYWLDSNTATGALTATFASSLGSACTIATVGAEGVTITENQTVGTTYNLTPPYGYNGDVLMINRALTAVEKALVRRVFQRSVPGLSAPIHKNTGFDSDTAWTKGAGWTIANGVATYTSGASTYLTQSGWIAGRYYNIKFDITAYSGANPSLSIYAGQSPAIATMQNAQSTIVIRNYKYVAVCPAANNLLFYGINSASSSFSIDNAFVQEIL